MDFCLRPQVPVLIYKHRVGARLVPSSSKSPECLENSFHLITRENFKTHSAPCLLSVNIPLPSGTSSSPPLSSSTLFSSLVSLSHPLSPPLCVSVFARDRLRVCMPLFLSLPLSVLDPDTNDVSSRGYSYFSVCLSFLI